MSERKSSLRAPLTGMVVGALLSACNIYSGLKIGWSSNMSVTGALVSFGVWRARSKKRIEEDPFTIDEANVAQTAASSAAAVSSAGLVAGIPALAVLTGAQLAWPALAAWVLSVCLLGIMIAIPLRQQLIVSEPLPFPMGVATAETLRQMYAKGEEAVARVRELAIAAVLAAVGKVLATFKIVSAVGLPGALGAYPLKSLTFALDPSLLLPAVGGMMGTRAVLSILLGSVVAYLGLGPYLLDAGLVAPGKPDASWYKQLVGWLLWPGVTLMVVSSLMSLALGYKSLLRGLAGLRAIGGGAAGDDGTVPMSWFTRGVAGAALLSITLQIFLFSIPWWAALIGVLLSGVLAIVGSRVAGETGVTPVGAMGKVTQLTIGAALPGNVAANLMTANVTGGSASQCADLMNDLKTGHVLGTAPRRQFFAQLGGALAGSLVGSAIYLALIPDPKNQLMTQEWAAPAVVTWKSVAEVFAVGLKALPAGTPTAMLVAAVIAAALAVAEHFLGADKKKWLPSSSAVGLAFVVPADQAVSMFLGGMAAIVVGRFAKDWTSRSWIVVCSGIIAGEGLTGAVLSIYAMLAG